jgi:hypothetical protein
VASVTRSSFLYSPDHGTQQRRSWGRGRLSGFNTEDLWRAADELLCHRLPGGHLPVRLVGMGVSGLDDTGMVHRMLFDGEERGKSARPAEHRCCPGGMLFRKARRPV